MWLPSHPSQGLMIKVCDNLVLYHIHNYVHYDSYIYDLSVLIVEREEYPEKNPRSTGEINYGNSTYMRRKSRPQLGLAFFPVVRGDAVTACATRASHSFLCVSDKIEFAEGERRNCQRQRIQELFKFHSAKM